MLLLAFRNLRARTGRTLFTATAIALGSKAAEYVLTDLGLIDIRGKSLPVRVYCLVGRKAHACRRGHWITPGPNAILKRSSWR
jgi:hypothetical protein